MSAVINYTNDRTDSFSNKDFSSSMENFIIIWSYFFPAHSLSLVFCHQLLLEECLYTLHRETEYICICYMTLDPRLKFDLIAFPVKNFFCPDRIISC